MEEKKVVKLGVTGVLLIIAIIVIAIMCIFICKLSKEKVAAEAKSLELQGQITALNKTIDGLGGTVGELQGKLKTISDTINPPAIEESSNTENTSLEDQSTSNL